MRYTFTLAAALLAMAFISASAARAADEKANDVAEGYIHTADLKAGTLVLGGRNESQTTFRFGVNKGEREATVLVDGKRATSLAEALKPRSKASISSVTVGKELWATKIEITTAEK